MREVIVLAGQNERGTSRVMRSLETQGYHSSLCRTVLDKSGNMVSGPA